eukprot:TRINITY_DN7083_c0_g1_i1.p1 TRINITY_DN7083_c0_g1~~TRINITY_DN7083_c0_g1_i1.p1  ORF type:complete len:253 (-),score=40.69 TRINITY_DN7083_c0_g1_i1:46-804(-)
MDFLMWKNLLRGLVGAKFVRGSTPSFLDSVKHTKKKYSLLFYFGVAVMEGTNVLVVGVGLGHNKVNILKEKFKNITIPVIPDPSDDAKEGAKIIYETIQKSDVTFDILIAGSRGGYVCTELLTQGLWKGPLLLISAMCTLQICSVPNVPILIAHGTNDGTNPIHLVRDNVTMSQWVLLKEFEGQGHDLRIIEEDEGKLLEELVIQTITWAKKKKTEKEEDKPIIVNSTPAKPNLSMNRLNLFAQIQQKNHTV